LLFTSNLVAAFAIALGQFAASNTGELHLTVVDASGLPLRSGVELVSAANQVRQQLETDPQGSLVAKRLPFGSYHLIVTRDAFAPFSGVVEIKSAVPTRYRVELSPASLQAQVTVTPEHTLLDPGQTTTAHRIAAETIRNRMTAAPGRSLADLVNAQPGWLLEANGILHPRGSEYQTQYVVDGLPLTDNRSPAFAPEIGAGDVDGMNILTAGYPAEYGRKLGGVIEVVTGGEARRGFHGVFEGGVASFAARSGDLRAAHSRDGTTFSLSAGVATTDRYLDPPVEENFTNHGTTSHLAARVERDVTARDRIGVIVRRGDARFLVPNERVQELAGQRQERHSAETAAQFSYQRIFSDRVVGDIRGLARDLSAGLQSNARSTPIIAHQDRGFREFYLKGAVSGQAGEHEWRAGADLNVGTVRESFSYQITDSDAFDDDIPPAFSFAARRPAREQALFLQDQWRRGPWTVNAGLRWDNYTLAVEDSAFSPRLAVAWWWPAANFAVRASYDRAFQTPAVENLLLASDAAVDALDDDVVRLPVQPSRGDFYDVGLSKTLFGTARIDISQYHRTLDNFADDDVLLNTGVGFPIAFHRARITGTEIKFHVPRWRTLSAVAGYSLMHGTGDLPITGGLFVGEEAEEALEPDGRFAISQDQRHTLRARVSNRFNASLWLALAASYDSGLPVEEFEDDRDEAIEQFGERIVERVNFEAGRVRPSFSIDASAGVVLHKRDARSVDLQIDVRNLTNRLNVINFSGLFSGSALAPPRSVAVRLRAAF
jgi:hypothetical protein